MPGLRPGILIPGKRPMADSGGFDWAHAISGLGGAMIGALTAIGAHIFRAGGDKPTAKLNLQGAIASAEQRLGEKIDAAEQRSETKIEGLVDQFHDSFAALRQKINDVELDTAKNFVAKSDFEDFRHEYRDDRSRMFRKLDDILSGRRGTED
jgi:hypothetical protein